MENSSYQYVLQTIEPFLKDSGFEFVAGEVEHYSNGARAFRVEYDEGAELLKLRTAVLEEGADVVWTDLSSWLFTEQSDKRDLTNIANDYLDTLQNMLSVKSASKVALPTKGAKGSTVSVDTFTGRFLDHFAALKPVYKEYMAEHGEFLYDNFYKTIGTEAVVNMFESGTKKQVAKFINFLNEAYVDGDITVQSIVTYNLLGGIYIHNPELKEKTAEHLEKNTYLKIAVDSMLSVIGSEKNRAKYLVD